MVGVDFVLFAGSANPALAEQVAAELDTAPAACAVERFPDGEVSVRLDESVRRREVFLIQPTAPPVDANLIELLALADACRRSAAARVTAVVPYFGYGRSDRRGPGRRSPITASLVAALMQAAGIDHVITIDLHTPQIEGFFHIPVDALSAVPTLCDELRDRLPADLVVVAPDAGRVKMATDYAHRLGVGVVVLHKRRDGATATEVTHVVGSVRGRPCLVVDDMISTGGTIAGSLAALAQAGARPEVLVAATHGLLLAGAEAKLDRPELAEVLVTDSVVVPAPAGGPRLRVASVAPLLARAIGLILAGGSLGDLE